MSPVPPFARSCASVDAAAILSDAVQFYAPDGALVDLRQRIVDSARKVWGKLNAKLREFERRNHRLEDLGARLKDWLKTRALYPEASPTRLSSLVPQAFDDFPNVVQLIEYTRQRRGR